MSDKQDDHKICFEHVDYHTGCVACQEDMTEEISILRAENERLKAKYEDEDELEDELEKLINKVNEIIDKDGSFSYDGEWIETTDVVLDDVNTKDELALKLAKYVYKFESANKATQYDGLPDFITITELKEKNAELVEALEKIKTIIEEASDNEEPELIEYDRLVLKIYGLHVVPTLRNAKARGQV